MKIENKLKILTREINKVGIVSLIVLAITLSFQAYLYYSNARELYMLETNRGGKGYVSDEVWYVNSARLIMNKIFGVKPRLNNTHYGLTIIYNSSLISREEIVKTIASSGLKVVVKDTHYSKINAIYIETGDAREGEKLLNILESKSLVVDEIWGWRIPDHAGINNYYNLEHPPMVKYIIGLSISVGYDNPIYWRLPSIIAGVLTNLFVYLAVSKFTKNYWLGNIASLLAGLDPLMKTMSSLALLDIYVALWTSITLYVLSCGKTRGALITVALGSLFKFNTLLILVPIAIYILTETYGKTSSLTVSTATLTIILFISALMTLGLQIASSLPLINEFGLRNWLWNSIFGAIKWHISIKCTKPPCPVSSNPWDWFIGRSGFVLYYYPNGEKLVATGFYPFWLLSLILSIYTYPVGRRFRSNYYASTSLIGVLGGYILLWLAGNRQQYSFYSVQFIPLVYSNLLLITYNVLLKPHNLMINLQIIHSTMKKLLKAIIEALSPDVKN